MMRNYQLIFHSELVKVKQHIIVLKFSWYEVELIFTVQTHYK